MFVIYNPTAGRRNARRLWSVLDQLTAHGVPVRVLETEYAGHASRLTREAVEAGASLVVAAGGDGTIAEVVSSLVGTRTRLGIIPLGTANVVALEYGLRFNPGDVASALVSSRSVPLWPGIMHTEQEDRLFVQMVGAGFDAHVVHRINGGIKRLIGRGAYVMQTLRELSRYDFPQFSVVIDGKFHKATGVVVTKGRLYGGPYTLAPEADPGWPGFHVAILNHAGAVSALADAGALLRSTKDGAAGVQIFQGSVIEIITPAGLPLQADGDSAGVVPVRISDAPAPVMLSASGDFKHMPKTHDSPDKTILPGATL